MKLLKFTLPDELKDKFAEEVAKRGGGRGEYTRVLRQFVRFYIKGGRLPLDR